MEVQETEVQEMSHVKKQKSKIHEISLACRVQVFVEFPAPRDDFPKTSSHTSSGLVFGW